MLLSAVLVASVTALGIGSLASGHWSRCVRVLQLGDGQSLSALLLFRISFIGFQLPVSCVHARAGTVERAVYCPAADKVIINRLKVAGNAGASCDFRLAFRFGTEGIVALTELFAT